MPPPPPPRTDDMPDRRQYWLAAIVLTVVILGLTAVAVVFMDARDNGDPVGAPQDTVVPRQRAIPRPGEGRDPTYATDRGGWGQYAVLGLTAAGMASIAGLAWRSGRRNRLNRGEPAGRTSTGPPSAASGPGARSA